MWIILRKSQYRAVFTFKTMSFCPEYDIAVPFTRRVKNQNIEEQKNTLTNQGEGKLVVSYKNIIRQLTYLPKKDLAQLDKLICVPSELD